MIGDSGLILYGFNNWREGILLWLLSPIVGTGLIKRSHKADTHTRYSSGVTILNARACYIKSVVAINNSRCVPRSFKLSDGI
jgi:hypothetical protein